MVRLLLPLLLLVAACGGGTSEGAASGTPAPSVTSHTSPSPTASARATATATRKATPQATARATPSDEADPRWHFYAADQRLHTSPWFTGAHRVMIGFGCTVAPYYDHDSRCPGREGFHHGIDVAMPCGTPLTSDVEGVVLAARAPGSPGPAYGVHPVRIRTGDVDLLIGHTREVFVHPGDRVRPGQRIALSSDSGAPDGCHLHFEVRRHGQGLDGALDPAALLRLS